MQPTHTSFRARTVLPFFRAFFVVALILGVLPLALHSQPIKVANAQATELFFSEYIEGSSNNKALEIYNGTGAPINLATGGYSIAMYFNGATTAGLTINLTGAVAAGDVYVVAHASANTAILAQADQTNGLGWFNGDDAVALQKGATIIDVIGQIGFRPSSEWGSGLQSTLDNTLRRKMSITAGDPNGSDAFDPSVQWDGFANNDSSGLGVYASVDNPPTITSTTPANGVTNATPSTNISIVFSEPVNVSGTWFTINCATSGAHPAGVTNTSFQTYTLDPTTDFVGGESCTVTVLAAQVQDRDSSPNSLSSDYSFSFATTQPCVGTGPITRIHTIQGSGTTAPAAVLGTTPTIEGIVVGDFQGNSPLLRGFYVQEENGEQDGDLATSEGIFVFYSTVDVSVGQKVRVTGTVTEYTSSDPLNATITSSLTELGGTVTVEICPGSPSTLAPTAITLPVTDWERYEGMSVQLPSPMTVSEVYRLGRFGEALLAPVRQFQFTHLNAPDTAAYSSFVDLFNRSTIRLDDARTDQNPDPVVYPTPSLSASNTLRVGDTLPTVVGVIEHRLGYYRIQPIQPLTFTPSNPRPTSAPSVGGTLKVASFNVLNYFNGPTFPTARGANTAAEFTRQRAKTISAIVGLNADIVGLMEMENDAAGAGSAIQDLVDGLNAAMGAGTYAYIDTGVLGSDEIRVALIYKPAVVTPVDAFMVDTDAINNRPPLAQTFRQNSTGEVFTVAVNHLKSKGCDTEATGLDANQNNGQSCYNERRRQQAQRLLTFVNSTIIPTSGDPDVLLIGDFNAYAKEEPIQILIKAGFVDETAAFGGVNAYSYVFDGQSGYLDQALASASLSKQITGTADWHINTDEPLVLDYNLEFKTPGQQTSFYAPNAYRASDHDPVLVGLALGTVVQPPPTAGTPNIGTFDPALSKIGILAEGQIGLPGEHLTWHITATNQGSGAGTNVQIVDTVRADMRIDSVEADRGTFSINGQTVTFTIPTLNPGESVEMRINTTVLESPLSGILSNDARLTGTGGDGSTATRVVTGQVPVATVLPATGYAPQTQANNLSSLWWIGLAALLIVTGGFVLRLKLAKR